MSGSYHKEQSFQDNIKSLKQTHRNVCPDGHKVKSLSTSVSFFSNTVPIAYTIRIKGGPGIKLTTGTVPLAIADMRARVPNDATSATINIQKSASSPKG